MLYVSNCEWSKKCAIWTCQSTSDTDISYAQFKLSVIVRHRLIGNECERGCVSETVTDLTLVRICIMCSNYIYGNCTWLNDALVELCPAPVFCLWDCIDGTDCRVSDRLNALQLSSRWFDRITWRPTTQTVELQIPMSLFSPGSFRFWNLEHFNTKEPQA